MPVIPFGTDRRGRIVVTAAPLRSPPFPVDALVEEDDTFHVLTGEPTFEPVEEHPIRALQKSGSVKPQKSETKSLL